jgi:hypothetical protein
VRKDVGMVKVASVPYEDRCGHTRCRHSHLSQGREVNYMPSKAYWPVLVVGSCEGWCGLGSKTSLLYVKSWFTHALAKLARNTSSCTRGEFNEPTEESRTDTRNLILPISRLRLVASGGLRVKEAGDRGGITVRSLMRK